MSEELENQIFKPTRRSMTNKALSSFFMLLGVFFAIRFLLMPEIYFGIKILLFLFCILWAIYLLFFVLYPLLSELIISDSGITYSQPFFSVFCDWNSITEVIYTQNHLELIFNQNAKVKDIFIVNKIIPQKNIPLHFFVNEFTRKENWTTEIVLVTLKKYLPDIAENIISTTN